MKTASKSQLNNWQLLKVAEDAPWQRRLSAKLNVFIPRVMRRSAGELSQTLFSRQAAAEKQNRAEKSSFFPLLVVDQYMHSGLLMMLLNWPTLSSPPLTPVILSHQPSPPISPAKCGAASLAVLSSHHLNSY